MGITIPIELEERIRSLTQEAGFESTTELLAKALDLMEATVALERGDVEELRRQIQIGIDSAERGEVFDGEEVMADIRRRIDRVAKGGSWGSID